MPLESQGELLSHNLHLLYLDSSSAWFDLLLQQGQPDEAISVATHALLIEPTHEGLVGKLYTCTSVPDNMSRPGKPSGHTLMPWTERGFRFRKPGRSWNFSGHHSLDIDKSL